MSTATQTGTVTIEGSITPSSVLPRGKRMTVSRTDYIDKLIAGGFVVVIDVDTTKPEKILTPVFTPQDTLEAIKAAQAAKLAQEDADLLTVPGRGASRDAWAAFLRQENITFTDEGRDALVALWYEDEDESNSGE